MLTASSAEQSGVRASSALRQRPIGKPRPQRLCFEGKEDGGSAAFLKAPLRTGLPDRAHFQGVRLPGTNFPDEPQFWTRYRPCFSVPPTKPSNAANRGRLSRQR
jgi:hypothetical protein